MKDINFDEIKKSALSFWAAVKPAFTQHGDKLLFVLALAVLVTALFRLGGGEKAISHAAAPEIVFTQWWQDEAEQNTLRKLIKDFESLHREIKIVLQTKPYEELQGELFSSGAVPSGGVSSGSVPPAGVPHGDIIALDPLWVPELVKRGTIESSTLQGYSVPALSFIDILYYNVEMLKDSGYIRPPKNRSELLSYAKAVTAKEKNRWGISLGGNRAGEIYNDLYPWFWAAGTRFIKDGKPAVNSRPVVDTLSFLASLNSGGLIAPGALSAETDGKFEDFVSSRAAFMIAPVSDIGRVKERMGSGAFGISSVPPPDNYSGVSFYGTAGWTAGVSSASAHKEEARLFAAFLADKAPLLSKETKAIPGIDTPPAGDDLYAKAWDIAISGESAADFSGLSGEHDMEAIFREELSALFEGKSTPAQAAAAIQKRWVEHKQNN